MSKVITEFSELDTKLNGVEVTPYAKIEYSDLDNWMFTFGFVKSGTFEVVEFWYATNYKEAVEKLDGIAWLGSPSKNILGKCLERVTNRLGDKLDGLLN